MTMLNGGVITAAPRISPSVTVHKYASRYAPGASIRVEQIPKIRLWRASSSSRIGAAASRNAAASACSSSFITGLL
jgi:hypothetical protein